MSQALTMEQILDNEDRREATQLSVKEIYELQAKVDRLEGNRAAMNKQVVRWAKLYYYQRCHRKWALKKVRIKHGLLEDCQKWMDHHNERADKAEGKAVEYQNKYYAEKQKCQNTHERALRYLKEHGLLDIKFRRAEADKAKLVVTLKHLHRAILVEFGGLQPHSNNVRKYIAEADAVLEEVE